MWTEVECDCGAVIEVDVEWTMYRCKQCKVIIVLDNGEVETFMSDHVTRAARDA